MTPIRCSLTQLALPGYREKFIEELRAALGDQLVLAVGLTQSDPSVRTGISDSLIDIHLNNRFFARRRLVIQPGYRQALKRSDVWFLELNPRVINTWLALVEGRLRRRQTWVWGHFKGRRASDSGPRVARRAMVRLANGVVAYTAAESELFRTTYPRQHVVTAPNASERASSIAAAPHGPRSDFLYVGRLVESKGVAAIVDAFVDARLSGLLPANARLVLVGTGPAEKAVAERLSGLSHVVQVLLVGEVFDSRRLDDLYSRAVAGVCGGYVGLNITQSLTRGVPFIFPTSASLGHAPEISLAEEGVTSFSFNVDVPGAAASVFRTVWDLTAAGKIDHGAIQQATLAQYSVELMAAGFLAVLQPADGDARPRVW